MAHERDFGPLELCGLIGHSPVMLELFDVVRRIAPHARVALLTGERGSGKEGIARALHRLGPRKSRRFFTVKCSAVVDRELFGHVRDAFTGAIENEAGVLEAADGGTLFLDEVGELPAAVQGKLLRVLETGEVQRVGALRGTKVDVHLVAATNRDLLVEANEQRFRSDLFYRLNVIEVRVPPLRERAEDIPYLAAAFVREFAVRFCKPLEGLSPAAERALQMRPWRGNVRELRNVLERACMLAEGQVVAEGDLDAATPSSPADHPLRRATDRHAAREIPTKDLNFVERDRIVQVLAEERGNKQAAADRLGLSRRTLYRRLERLQ